MKMSLFFPSKPTARSRRTLTVVFQSNTEVVLWG
jgi:hypothetical protein